MNFVDSALRMLRRPVSPAGEPGRKQSHPGEHDALTEAEMTAALEQLTLERRAAEALLNSAADRREELLALPGTDAAILALGREIDHSQLTLERLDRLEPELIRRRGEIRFNARGAAWEADRDTAAAAFADFSAAIRTYHAARAEWSKVLQDLTAQWPTAVEIAPRMPMLDGATAGYEAELEAFRVRVIVLKPPARPVMHSLQSAINFAVATGAAPDGVPPDWLIDIARAMTGEAAVRMLLDTLDADGRPVARGAIRTVAYDIAEKLVRSGRATYYVEG